MQTSLQTRLTRSSQDRVLAGVAGGLARYFNIDATITRLIMVALFFFGIGLILYPLLWLLMPGDEHATSSSAVQPGPGARFHPLTGEPLNSGDQSAAQQLHVPHSRSLGQRKRLFGMVLIGLGSFILVDMLFPWASSLVFPLLMIIAGLILISKGQRRQIF